MGSQTKENGTPQAGVIALLRRCHQIKIEALGALSKGNLFELEEICEEAMIAIEAAHRVLSLSDVGEIGKGLPARPPEPRTTTFLTGER